MKRVYHAGELAIQDRAGVRGMAERIGRGIGSQLSPAAQQFLAHQPFAILSSHDSEGNLWTSLLHGEPGFAQALDATIIKIGALPHTSDPLESNLLPGAQLGLLVIEPKTRKRIRINGTVAERTSESFVMHVNQSYGNCPKYIQARSFETLEAPSGTTNVLESHSLQEHQQDWIRNANTFFVATAHPEGGADASHRGGKPGFVKVTSEGNLEWPEYAGNTMYNTLGNIESTGKAGLLFLEFGTGDLLHLTGSAKVLWDAERIAQHEGAQLLVEFQPTRVLERRGALAARWQFESYSPYNP